MPAGVAVAGLTQVRQRRGALAGLTFSWVAITVPLAALLLRRERLGAGVQLRWYCSATLAGLAGQAVVAAGPARRQTVALAVQAAATGAEAVVVVQETAHQASSVVSAAQAASAS